MLTEQAVGTAPNKGLQRCISHKITAARCFSVLLPAAALALLLSGAAGADNSSGTSGAGTPPPTSTAVLRQETLQAQNLPAPYSQVLEKYCADLEKPEDEFNDDDYAYSCSIHELRQYVLPSSKRSFGYFLKDLDDDGIPELMLGVNPGYGIFDKATEIIGIYTIADGKAKCLKCGWSRSNYALNTDKSISHLGSSGASNSVAMQYILKDHELHVKDGVRMKDTPRGAACYRITQDDIYAEPSEKDAISDQEYRKYFDSLGPKARLLKLTPMPVQ